jgi:hypothetical protein
MTLDELKRLIPPYMAGTLDPEERREVEDALITSAALKRELTLWRHAKGALEARVAELAGGHLTPEQIVDRAMGLTPGKEMLEIDRHLASCSLCGDELRLVNECLGSGAPDRIGVIDRLSAFLHRIRPSVAIPLVAGALALVVFILVSRSHFPIETPVPEHEIPGIVNVPERQEATLWLTYRAAMRSTSGPPPDTLIFTGSEKQIRIHIAIPQNQVTGIAYSVALESAGRRPFRLNETLTRFATGAGYDSLQFTIPDSVINKVMVLTLTEVLPPQLQHSLTPEDYTFEIILRP